MSKKRNRQPDANCERSEGSTDSCEEHGADSKCPHVAKSVNLNKIKKNIKSTGVAISCPSCRKDENDGDETDTPPAALTLWLCLQCGQQGCGRGQSGHALEHYGKPHSDCHYLVVDVAAWSVWCYRCEAEVNPASRKKLQETVDFVRKLSVSRSRPTSKISSSDSRPDPRRTPTESKVLPDDPPRVAGLQNLGNTCFFNAVLQCLAQTPFLVKVLEDQDAGARFRLPGGKHRIGSDEDEVELPPIEGTLERSGRFTSVLSRTLSDTRSGNISQSPRELLSAWRRGAARLHDGRQHDAHELLRHLLELVRNEDLRRYRSVILKSLGLTGRTDPTGVSTSLRSKVKFYGDQAASRLLGADTVFGGVLVSTLECLDCGHTSQSREPFFDLSLPVMPDKPQPPVMKRKSNGHEETAKVPSARQLQREKRIARKNRRDRLDRENEPEHNLENSLELHLENSVENNVENNAEEKSLQSKESDADVEDNAEEQREEEEKEVEEEEERKFSSSEKAAAFADRVENSVDSEVSANFNGESIENIEKETDCNGVSSISSGVSRLSLGTRYTTREGECSVQSCLNQFTALELMSGSNRVGCEACTKREQKTKDSTKLVCTPSTKQYLISRVPPVLILHLKRFQAQGVDFRKLARHVTLPVLLDLFPVTEERRKRVYGLYGLVEHRGTIHGGHYVAYVKSRSPPSADDPRWSFLPSSEGGVEGVVEIEKNVEEETTSSDEIEAPPGRWYCASDSRVTEVEESEVLLSQAYLLFYERLL